MLLINILKVSKNIKTINIKNILSKKVILLKMHLIKAVNYIN